MAKKPKGAGTRGGWKRDKGWAHDVGKAIRDVIAGPSRKRKKGK